MLAVRPGRDRESRRPLDHPAGRNLEMDLGERTASSVPRPRPRRTVHDRLTRSSLMRAITVIKIPPRCPRANCFAERLVLTIRTEITDRMLIFGTRHLHRVLAEYAAHYNMRRPHRALHLRPPRPRSPALS
jgi:putative transposase